MKGSMTSGALALAVAIAVAIGSGPAQAALKAEGISGVHAGPTPRRGLELAAKKKKKKAGGKKRPVKPGAAPAADDDAGDDSGGDDASGSADSGAGDEDVKKAARISPKPSPDSGDDSPPASAKRSARTDETIVARAPEPSGPSGPLPRALDISGGARVFLRSLTFAQLVRGDVKEYQPRLLGGAGVSLTWYPAAHFTDGMAANIGLDVNVEQAFGITSRTSDGASFPTAVHDYNGAARFRLPLGSMEAGAFVGYGQHAFTLTGGQGVDRSVLTLPDIVYYYVRPGLSLRVALPANLSLTVVGAYRHVLSVGEIKTKYFPHLSVKGIDAGVGLGYPITSSIEARVGFDIRRYFYDMHSVMADPYIAGGAVDQYLTGTISVAMLLGGSEGGGKRSSSRSSDDDGGSSRSGDEDEDHAKDKDKDKDADVKVAPISPLRRKKKPIKAEPEE